MVQDNPVGSQNICIIPRPLEIKSMPGEFKITSTARIIVDAKNPELKNLGTMLKACLNTLSLNFPVVEQTKIGAGGNIILLTLSHLPDTLGKEGYQLTVGPHQIVAKATNVQSIFYALQSIYELLPSSPSAKITISAMKIIDTPRFVWRGMMLDVCRHFYPVDFVKKFSDYLAMYKMNSFYWHLSDDRGWRIEIKKHPKLTQVGAWRNETMEGKYIRAPDGPQFDHLRYGGFYTTEWAKFNI